MTVKRPGGLERSALSLLRRSARTKIRRNSTASNDTRHDVSRLRQTVNANGEYPAVSLVDPGPLPRPSESQESDTTPTPEAQEELTKPTKEAETQPSKRFVSTLRDSSKPTITTYVEPHLLEQQRKDQEANGELNEGEETPSFRISAPGKLENTAAAQLLAETLEKSRKDKLDNFTISYPIPPPVKLAHNLLQQPSSQDPSAPSKPAGTQQQYALPAKNKQSGQGAAGIHTHQKKPSSWSWLWGKEKGEKGADGSTFGGAGSSPGGMKSAAGTPPQTLSTEINTPTASSSETTVKKQSTLSMLFSRSSKSNSAKAQATTAETTHSVSMNGQSLTSDRPKYSNYNRLPIHIERAIYRLSHVKLANPRRPLHEQVLISNMMFWYLGVIQQQQLLQQQQQADLQQQQTQQQRPGSKDSAKGGESKEDKEGKKPKKKKSQKKKNQQRGSGKSAERVVKGPEYEKQQQQNMQVQHSPRPRQQGSSITTGGPAHQQQLQQQQQYGRSNQNGQVGHEEESRASGTDYSDSYEESDGDDSSAQGRQELIGSQSDTLTSLSIQSARMTAEEEDEDDDVPLAHYQNMPSRQGVPVS